LVQREGVWASCGPTQSRHCSKCNSPPINDQCTNFSLCSVLPYGRFTSSLTPSPPYQLNNIIISFCTHKFDRGLSRLLHTELHWLDVFERVVYKLGVMLFNCLHGQAPQYLVELCQPVAGVASRQHLRSATRQLLVVPRHQLGSYGRRAFCVAGPSVWNSLPDSLRNPIIGDNSFRQSLKTCLFATY